LGERERKRFILLSFMEISRLCGTWRPGSVHGEEGQLDARFNSFLEEFPL